MYEPSTAERETSQASFAQQRLWFLEQLDQGGCANSVAYHLRLRGALRVEDLRASLQDVVDGHPALRTVLRQNGVIVTQAVLPPGTVDLPVADLSGPGAPALPDVLRDLAGKPFDLATGPLIRATLLRTGAEEHVLALVIHHAAVDSRSLEVLRSALAAGYNARAGRPPAVGGAGHGPASTAGSPAFSYADYSAWQREQVAGLGTEADLAYWRGRLDGAPPLDLPADRSAPGSPTGAGGYITRLVPESLVRGLRELAAEQGATLSDMLASAVSVLLSRYTGSEDISLGSTVPGRDHPLAADLIGAFANTVVLRTDLAGATSFRDVLSRVRATAAAAAEHAAVPFDLVVQKLRPRQAGRTPFFQVYVGADESDRAAARFTGLTAEVVPPEVTTAAFDLAFGLHAGEAGAVLDSGYSADLFDRASAERMLGHLGTLLKSVVAAPDAPVRALDILTGPEREDILGTWNDTGQPYPDQSCLHDLFEQSAIRAPGAIAVVCGARHLSYAQLREQSATVAGHLAGLGVRPGDIVGVCLRRSLEQAAVIVGILRAGAAFLPLDPDYPAQRVSYMVKDSGCRAVVAAPELRALVEGATETVVSAADLLASRAASLPRVTADDPAYVIYTSGSTGEPKGIVLRHRGAVNNFTDFNRRFGIGPGDRLLAVASPGFDMSVYDLLGTLAAGATVIFPEPDAVREPARWAQLMRRHAVTVWHSAPALLELALDAGEDPASTGGDAGGSAFLDVRLALLGGDWIPVSLPGRLRRSAPECEVISLGGATEASMDSIIFTVGQVDPAWASIPYGRPMANQRAYILDRNLQPLPVGVPGELHLAGVGLAAGYLNRPELTAQRFVTHTFANGRTERLYKTGDLARYRPDGVIELLGRLDFQVKVHGLRIETGEIEALLRKHRAVREAIVVPRGERGHTVLTAVIVPREGHQPTQGDLHAWLEQSLPASMVPAAILVTGALPVTPNGKVDRKALMTFAGQRCAQPSGDVPATDAELRVAAAWSRVLGVQDIGLDDNFFDLGGDSFTAVRAVMEINRAMPVVELMQHPTVRALAGRVTSAGEFRDLLEPLRPDPEASAPALVCVPYGGGSAIAFRDLAESLPASLAVWGVSLPGHDPGSIGAEPVPFSDAVRACADEIEAKAHGPIALYGHCAGSWLTIALARELEDRALDLRAVIVGAALPHPDPVGSLRAEAVTSDQEWADFLRSMGGLDGPLDWASLDQIMKVGREDHIGSMRFQADSREFPPDPIDAPLHCVFGLADQTLDRFRELYGDWSLWARDVSVSAIGGGGHYFVRTHAAELAAIIAERLAAAQALDRTGTTSS